MNLSGVGFQSGTHAQPKTADEPPRGAALAQQVQGLATSARTVAANTMRQTATTVATSSRRRRRVQKLRVNGAIDDAQVRELLTWAELTLAPRARWRRLRGLAIALAVAVFVFFWPFMVLIGAGMGFGGAVVCYLAVLAAMAPFALLGERDKARDVIQTLNSPPAPDGWRPTADGPMVWPG